MRYILKEWSILSFLLCLVLLAGCTFDNEEALFKDVVCPEIVEPVSYLTFVKPLLDRRCLSCHNSNLPSGNVNIQTYDLLKPHIENGSFLGAIHHTPGFSPMPQGSAKLSDCDIEKIESWINNGFPQN